MPVLYSDANLLRPNSGTLRNAFPFRHILADVLGEPALETKHTETEGS
jgi:hypothetical protein